MDWSSLICELLLLQFYLLGSDLVSTFNILIFFIFVSLSVCHFVIFLYFYRGHGTTDLEGEVVATVCGVIERVNKLVYVRTLRARSFYNLYVFVLINYSVRVQ